MHIEMPRTNVQADFCTVNPVVGKVGSLFCTAPPNVAEEGGELLSILSFVDMANPDADLAIEVSF